MTNVKFKNTRFNPDGNPFHDLEKKWRKHLGDTAEFSEAVLVTHKPSATNGTAIKVGGGSMGGIL